MRLRRTPAERILYAAAYGCRNCGKRVRVLDPAVGARFEFAFSRFTLCPSCGTTDVRAHPRRDHVDRVSRHPLSQLMRLSGAPRYHCHACRLRYHDWRGRAARDERPTPDTSGPARTDGGVGVRKAEG